MFKYKLNIGYPSDFQRDLVDFNKCLVSFRLSDEDVDFIKKKIKIFLNQYAYSYRNNTKFYLKKALENNNYRIKFSTQKNNFFGSIRKIIHLMGFNNG